MAQSIPAIAIIAIIAGAATYWKLTRPKSAPVPADPEKIRLKPLPQFQWSDKGVMEMLTAPILGRGFVDLGAFAIPHLPKGALQMLVSQADGAVALVYEHPVRGHWLEIVSYHSDGAITIGTTSTSAPRHRPETIWLVRPGLTSGALLTRFLQERPRTPLKPVTRENAAALYEEAYETEREWIKAYGNSPKASNALQLPEPSTVEAALAERGDAERRFHDQAERRVLKEAEDRRIRIAEREDREDAEREAREAAQRDREDRAQREREALQTLSLFPPSTADQIKAAYKTLLRQYHPDLVGHLGPEFNSVALEKSQAIIAAYQELKRLNKV